MANFKFAIVVDTDGGYYFLNCSYDAARRIAPWTFLTDLKSHYGFDAYDVHIRDGKTLAFETCELKMPKADGASMIRNKFTDSMSVNGVTLSIKGVVITTTWMSARFYIEDAKYTYKYD